MSEREEFVCQVGAFQVMDTFQKYNITFHNNYGEVGLLDFNGPTIKFESDADESAKVFFELVEKSFNGRLQKDADEIAKLKQERDELLNITADCRDAAGPWYEYPEAIGYPEEVPSKIKALKQERDELAAQLIKARDAVRANHNWHNDNDEYDGYSESELYDQNMDALSLTGPAALAEVKARTLEEAASTLEEEDEIFRMESECDSYHVNGRRLRELAAAKRKGE